MGDSCIFVLSPSHHSIYSMHPQKRPMNPRCADHDSIKFMAACRGVVSSSAATFTSARCLAPRRWYFSRGPWGDGGL